MTTSDIRNDSIDGTIVDGTTAEQTDTAVGCRTRLLAQVAGRARRVLVLGLESPALVPTLVAAGCTVTAVDDDAELVKTVHGSCERTVVGEPERLDLVTEFGTQSFDVVLLDQMLGAVKDPDVLLRRLAEIVRPDGWIGISAPNASHTGVLLSLVHGDLPAAASGASAATPHNLLTRERLLEHVVRGGFRPVRTVGVTVPAEEIAARFPDDERTRSLLASVESEPDRQTQDFVVAAVLDHDAGGLAGLLALSDAEREQAVRDSRQWQDRAERAAAEITALRAELERLIARRDVEIAAGLAPLRLELLEARDDLVRKERQVELVCRREEDRVGILRLVEAECAELHQRLAGADSAEEARLREELSAVYASRTWRLGQRLSRVARRVVR
jgi:2-polyprenyl-3-methyl-5-hydroxy-6-metoxy-1,4-benzoquinol methylase